MSLVPAATSTEAAPPNDGCDGPEDAEVRHVATVLARLAPKPLATGESKHCIVVDAVDLFDAAPELYPLAYQWERLAVLLRSASQLAWGQGAVAKAPKLRLARVPGPDFARSSLSQLRVADVGRFVRTVGTLTRAGAVKVVQELRQFRCTQCGHLSIHRASPSAGYEFDLPSQCRSGETKRKWDAREKRPKVTKCHSKDFVAMPPDEGCMSDFQEVRLQDQMQTLGVGSVPKSIPAILFGDLAGSIQPGDTVAIEGVIHKRWKQAFQGKRVELELFLEVTHAERLAGDSPVNIARMDLSPERREAFERIWTDGSDVWQTRSRLVAATAPWLQGLPVPKLALLLTLIGGTPALKSHTETATGSGSMEGRWDRFRGSINTAAASAPVAAGPISTSSPVGGDSATSERKSRIDGRACRETPHLLLLGDPGTGKSQLLQAAQELAGRSIRTTGMGCTNAGLTCAAVRDGPDFVLEAGALVLADGGVCCIDEFSMIRSQDRAAVHEAMEQQTVSVAKAGLVCRLRSECSVVAAQNCRRGGGRAGSGYDCGASVAVNSGLPPPLLSRFDLVVVFADRKAGGPAEADQANYIVGEAMALGGTDVRVSEAAVDGDEQQIAIVGEPPAPMAMMPGMSHDILREYVAWARLNSLDGGAEQAATRVLEAYFTLLRASAAEDHTGGGITVRTFESLLRLAQAHARLMHHPCVKREDAVAVVLLHRAALQDHVVGIDVPSAMDEGSTGGEGSAGGEQFAPTLRDPHAETPVCSVALNFGMPLHHGVDIASRDTYVRLEAKILHGLRLRLRPDGHLEEDVTLALGDRSHTQPSASGPAPSQEGWAASPPAAAQASVAPSQGAGRGRRLGFRPR